MKASKIVQTVVDARGKTWEFGSVMTNQDQPEIPDTLKLPCDIFHKVGGHYANRKTWFETGSGRRFKPVFVAHEEFKNPRHGYGRTVYKCTANGETFHFWVNSNGGKCRPFKNSEINPNCKLVTKKNK